MQVSTRVEGRKFRAFRLVLALLVAAVVAGTALAQQAGGKYVLGRGVAPSILDPHKTGEASASEILYLIGGSLVTLHPDTMAVGPGLAHSYEQTEDGLTFTFYLREGVTFHNGDPLTAHDWKFTYDRAKDPATQAGPAGDMLAGVSSVEVVDDYTLVIHLSSPSAVFLRTLASGSYLSPLSRRALEEQGDAYGREPVGVGPFKFKEWIAGYSITLERNPDYAWAPYYMNNQGTVYPDEIEFRYLPEAGTAVAALEAGEIDVAGVSAADLFLFEDSPNFEIYTSMQNGISLLFNFNLADPKFQDVRVRRALSHAIDRDFFIDRMVDGFGVPATGPLPQTLPGYDPNSVNSLAGFDREAAAALLDEAGWTLGADGFRSLNGERITIRIVAYSAAAVVLGSELLQNQLRQVGVDATVEVYDRTLQTPMVMQGDFDMAPLGWFYNDPDVLYFLYHSSQHPNGINQGNVNDPVFDALLELGRNTLVDEERMQVYHEAQRVWNEKAFGVPIYVGQAFTVVNSRLQGVRLDLLGGMLLQEMWIED